MSASPTPLSSTPKNRQKILLVDDLEENLVVLQKILAPLDVELVMTGSGEEALVAMSQFEFSLMILDVMMPGMDGYALAGKLRSNPKTHGIPLIFITGSQPDDHDIAKGYGLGAVDYIVKPFAPGVLTNKVESFLEIDRKLKDLERQRAELKISESERIKEAEVSAERYRMLFQNMPSGFSLHEMIYDEQGKAVDYTFIRVNPAFERLTGLQEKSVIGKTVKEVLPGIEDHWIDLYAQVVETGEPAFYENYSKELGKYFSVRAFRPSPGQFATLFSDITESKQLQQAIEKQIVALTLPLEDIGEISFDELFNLKDIQRIQDEFAAATNVASIITHPNGTPITQASNFTDLCGKIIRCTAKGCANCIISDAEIGRAQTSGPTIQPCLSGGLWDAGASITVGGKHIASWFVGQVRDESHPEENMLAYAREIGADEEQFIEAFRRVPSMSKERFSHVANALYTLANQLSTSAYQNIQQARFISDEKKRTKELRRLSTAIEQSPEVIVITDTDGVIEYANPAFERTTGYTCAEAIGQKTSLLSSGKHTDAFYEAMWKTLTSGKVWQGKIVNKRKDGSLYTEEAVISPVKSTDGAITNYVAVKRDITNELANEEKIQHAQKMEAVGQLAGGIAHDFNNILQTIMGFSDLLMLSMNPTDDQARDNVEQIQNAAQHAADLTRQLLAFSRKQHVEFAKMNLNDLIKKSKGFITSVLGESIELKLELGEELHTINADFRQLERTILNMTINARDAMPKGGRFTVKTENVEVSEGGLAGSQEAPIGNYVCLSLSDTGIGIPKNIIGHIFEPFFTTKGPGKGTGLGLAAIYGIIRKHMGWINVYSEPDKGSVFKIYLPISEEPTRNSTEKHPQDISFTCVGNGQRILVVEDAEAVRKLSVNELENAGYRVTSVKSAEDAERLFKEENGNFDLLFSDVILPGKNGADLAVTLRKIKPDLNVLLCSGYSGNRIEETGADLKNFSFLEKPFSMKKLAEEVHQILST